MLTISLITQRKNMMKYMDKWLVVLTLVFGCFSQISGQKYNSAAGISLGTHFAGDYKVFMTNTTALELIAGLNSDGGANIVGGAFYEFMNTVPDYPDFDWYYGFGGFIQIGDRTAIAPGAIIGLEYTMPDEPFNFFINLMPLIYFNSNGFDVEGSIGARYIMN